MEFITARIVTILKLLLLPLLIEGKRSRDVNLPGKYCSSSSREIDGAAIRSSSNPLYANSACVLKFKSDDSLMTTKRIMINFERFNVTDCSVKLKVFYSYDSHGVPVFTADCHTTGPIMPLYSNSKYVTIRLDKQTLSGYNFKIVLTTYKRKLFCGGDYNCGEGNGYCIDDDLQCDRVKNCLDGRDELNCIHNMNVGRIMRVGMKSMIAISICVVALCLICTGVCFFYCRRRRAHQGTIIRTNQPMEPTVTTTAGPPPGSYPMQPTYPPPAAGQPPLYPPIHQGSPYPPAPGYQQPYSDQGPYQPPPPLHQQVSYSAGRDNVTVA